MALRLREPTLNDEFAFRRAFEATRISDATFAHFYGEGMPYLDWINVLEGKRRGIDSEPGVGPSNFLFAWVGNDIVGRLTFRPFLEDSLLKIRGHIGYVVLPEFRCRGYATEMLRLALPLAKSAGLKRMLLTCDNGNVGSQKTIERCGGIFDGLYPVPGNPVPKMMYWIELQ